MIVVFEFLCPLSYNRRIISAKLGCVALLRYVPGGLGNLSEGEFESTIANLVGILVGWERSTPFMSAALCFMTLYSMHTLEQWRMGVVQENV